VTVLVFGSSDPSLFEQFHLEKAKNLNSNEVEQFFDWQTAKSPVLKICLQRTLDANTMSVLTETEIQQTLTPTPNGLNIENEHDTRSYGYKK
jgi:hypothetical protein